MTETTVEAADPTSITSRTEFGRALTALRTRAGLSIRDVVDASGALHGTVAGWFSGQHLPTRASEPAFRTVRSPGSGRGGDPRRRSHVGGRTRIRSRSPRIAEDGRMLCRCGESSIPLRRWNFRP